MVKLTEWVRESVHILSVTDTQPVRMGDDYGSERYGTVCLFIFMWKT